MKIGGLRAMRGRPEHRESPSEARLEIGKSEVGCAVFPPGGSGAIFFSQPVEQRPTPRHVCSVTPQLERWDVADGNTAVLYTHMYIIASGINLGGK